MNRKPGFYERRVFPWLLEKMIADPEVEKLRAEALAPARGRIIEIGFGTGANLPFYPAAVESVVAVEPNEGMSERAAPAVHASRIPVQTILGAAEELPLGSGAFDTAVSVLTLCSVADPARALAELRRVLRDDGRLLIAEHGLSEEPAVARWQHRLNGIQRVVGCGCNLDRPILDLVQRHGFRIQSQRSFYLEKSPRTHGWMTVGVAVTS